MLQIHRRKLSINERKMIKGVAEGTKNPNSRLAREILSRPHVAIALESVLNTAGLTDEKLCHQLKNIINRRQTMSQNVNTKTKSTNQTAVDANAVQAIRTIWQVKQYFKESTEGQKTPFGQLSDTQLDSIIAGGADVIQMTQIKQKEQKARDVKRT